VQGSSNLVVVAHAGQEIEGADGFRLLLVKTAAETDGELLEMEGEWGGDGQLPADHFHPRQNEHFEVLEGAVRTIIDGAERRYSEGETFDVPAGTPHQMTGDGPARVKWQVRPALRTAEFFERLYSDGPHGAKAMGAAFLEEFSDEFRLTGS
jgi:mannose-6-phosphate isomerase-like protein (cupin superfamily)